MEETTKRAIVKVILEQFRSQFGDIEKIDDQLNLMNLVSSLGYDISFSGLTVGDETVHVSAVERKTGNIID